MKFHLRKTPGNEVALQIDTKNLVTAVQNCNMGEGTLSSPIVVDGFTSFVGGPNADFPKFMPGETITFEIESEDGENLNEKLVCCTFQNIGKKQDFDSSTTIELYKSIFDCGKDVMPLIDGSLCVSPNSKITAEITVSETSVPPKDWVTYYMYYSIVFSLEIEKGNLLFFKIDPVTEVYNEEAP